MLEWYLFNPQDVWLFRDSRPFTAQQNFVARSLFPPNPHTMTGALKSAILESWGVDWERFKKGDISNEWRQAVGGPNDLGNFYLTGPFVAANAGGRVSRYMQAPADLLQEKNGGLVLLNPQTARSFETNTPFDDWLPLGFLEGGSVEEAVGWLDEDQMIGYLNGVLPDASLVRDSSLFLSEVRPGVGLQPIRTAEEGLFYHAEFIRPCPDVGLLAAIPAGLLPERGVMGMGGESRKTVFQRVDYQPPEQIPVSDGRIRVVLLTPAYFSQGWYPKNYDWRPWLGDAARLVSMALGKPFPVSGWDLVRRRPKPLRHFVPTGSVYFFENAVAPKLPFTESPPEVPQAGASGYGQVAIGKWDYL